MLIVGAPIVASISLFCRATSMIEHSGGVRRETGSSAKAGWASGRRAGGLSPHLRWPHRGARLQEEAPEQRHPPAELLLYPARRVLKGGVRGLIDAVGQRSEPADGGAYPADRRVGAEDR